MGFSRPEAKLRAQASLRGARPYPALVTLAYLALTVILTYVVLLLAFSASFIQMFAYVMAGYELEDVMLQLHPMYAAPALYLILMIVLNLYTMVMTFGYTSYSFRLARNERPGFRNLLDGFHMLGRALGVNILTFIFTFLWGMLAMIPYIVVLTIGAVLESTPLIVVAFILLILGLIFEYSVMYRYRLATYFILDNPGMSSLEAISRSKQAMKGWKWKLFVLDLSFLGWEILSMLTFGILGLWVTPYRMATVANFYDFVVHGGYSSPDFRQNPNGAPNGDAPPPPLNPGPGF